MPSICLTSGKTDDYISGADRTAGREGRVVSAERWQLLPDLGAEEFAALKASIAESGVLIPVTYEAETNEVVDGHQRLRAVAELRAEGTIVSEPMKQLRHFGSDEERIAFVITSNVQRRKLTGAQRRDLVGEALRRLPSLSDRRLALMSGVDGKTVAAVRNELEGRAEIPHVETRADTLGRQQPTRRVRSAPTIFVQSKRDARRAGAALTALGDDASGVLGLSRAEERARDARVAQLRSTKVQRRSKAPLMSCASATCAKCGRTCRTVRSTVS